MTTFLFDFATAINVIAIVATATATVVYAFYSIRLWRATRRQADIASITLILNYAENMTRQAAEAKKAGHSDAAFIETYAQIIIPALLKRLVNDLDVRTDADGMKLIGEIEGAMKAHNVDTQFIPGMKDILTEIEKRGQK